MGNKRNSCRQRGNTWGFSIIRLQYGTNQERTGTKEFRALSHALLIGLKGTMDGFPFYEQVLTWILVSKFRLMRLQIVFFLIESVCHFREPS